MNLNYKKKRENFFLLVLSLQTFVYQSFHCRNLYLPKKNCKNKKNFKFFEKTTKYNEVANIDKRKYKTRAKVNKNQTANHQSNLEKNNFLTNLEILFIFGIRKA